MAAPVISVRNLGKRYRLGAALRHDTLRDQFADAVKSLGSVLGGRAEAASEENSAAASIWALKGVSFDAAPGEVIGIIGRNGAGKSTLLKVLSQITEPTEGEVRIRGRLASLLEVGTGFHPELSGRENIFLNGAILGMTKAEIKRKFDEIVAFAEVEKFLDTPVKRYSSGMYVRLAFAVAAHLEPEILVVDEVLAVGDSAFQSKCLGKMEQVAKTGGRTILFVSHNMSAVQVLCGRTVYLKAGRVAGIGEVDEQVRAYLSDIKSTAATDASGIIPLGQSLELRRLSLQPSPVGSGAPLKFALEIFPKRSTRLYGPALLFYSVYGSRVAILDLRLPGNPYSLEEGRPLRLRGTVKSLPLVEGDYRVGLHVACTEYYGDYLDLTSLTVFSQPDREDNVPYPAAHRGFVELQRTLEREP